MRRLVCALTHWHRTVHTHTLYLPASRTVVELTECSIRCLRCGRVIHEWIDR